MRKHDLIETLSVQTSLPMAELKIVVEHLFDLIATKLSEGEAVQIVGFGSFETRIHGPKKGRNPNTGESLLLPERTVPVFSASKRLRDRVKGDDS